MMALSHQGVASNTSTSVETITAAYPAMVSIATTAKIDLVPFDNSSICDMSEKLISYANRFHSLIKKKRKLVDDEKWMVTKGTLD
eukprot:jgi/Bigna1/138762/aug1.46_g13470